jgi:hypothetical protein
MRPTENIEKLIKNTNIETNARTDDVVLDKVVRAFEESKEKDSPFAQPSIWRIIMKSRMTKLAAVAAVVLLFSLLSINILIKSSDTEHVVTKIDTSPRYILFDAQNYYLNQKEMMPCNILPVLPSQF